MVSGALMLASEVTSAVLLLDEKLGVLVFSSISELVTREEEVIVVCGN